MKALGSLENMVISDVFVFLLASSLTVRKTEVYSLVSSLLLSVDLSGKVIRHVFHGSEAPSLKSSVWFI